MLTRTHKKRKPDIFTIITGIILFGYLGYLCAGAWNSDHDALEIMNNLTVILKNPFGDYRNAYTIRGILIFVVFFIVLYTLYMLNGRDYIAGEEMGSEHFMDPSELSRKLSDPNNDADDPKNVPYILKRSIGYAYGRVFLIFLLPCLIISVIITIIIRIFLKQNDFSILIIAIVWGMIFDLVFSYVIVNVRWYKTEYNGKFFSLLFSILFYPVIAVISSVFLKFCFNFHYSLILFIILSVIFFIAAIITSIILYVVRKKD